MKFDRNELSKAVQAAVSMGAVAAVGVAGTAMAQTAPPAPAQANQQNPQTLQTIVVTGSHIRRVDLETSNPVVAVTAQQIQATGALTIGDVMQRLPVITGGLENPSVNNGGGSGRTLVGLRGLGAARTLVLVDGQRVASYLGNGVDINSIPAVAVERIEVLTDGASAIYGSDAIGGVINIILKTNYQGAQFSANYGISDHGDAERKGGSFVFGQTSDKGSILAGVDYNKFDPLFQSQRGFSKNALALSATNTSNSVALPGSGVAVAPGGSSYAARDRIFLPLNGCSSLSLNESAAAAGTSPTTLADYHCFGGADKYNYASVNLLMTPQERTDGFFKGTYHLSDNVDFYATVYHQKSIAASNLAPAVFGTGLFATGFKISAQNYYNPFGVDFTTNGNTYAARAFPAGDRHFANTFTTDQLMTGFKGDFNIGQQNWQWDAGYNYGHISNLATNYGLPNQNLLNTEAGPSFLNADGVVQCGTAASPIALSDCTPFDPFNLFNANSSAAIAAASAPSMVNTWYIERAYHAGANGGVIDLPAGTMQLAVGVSYRKEYTNNTVASDLLINQAAGYTCTLGTSCTSKLQGGFNVKEAYAELLIPILKDMPFIQTLNIDIGDRYSKYSSFGSTNNWKIGVEYKPIDDLLLRGTVATVFRAPTIGNVFGAPASSAPLLSADPCDHITTPGNPACANVPTDGSFADTFVASGQQIKAITTGSAFAHFPLGPESGKSFDFGAVYSPHYVPGLSATLDIWRIYLNNAITTVGAQSVLNLCFNGQTVYCGMITRSSNPSTLGQPQLFILPTANLGRLDVKGVDFSANYKLPTFAFGQFNVGVQATYMTQAKVQSAPGQQGNSVLNYVGVMGSTGSSLAASCPTPGFSGGPGAICFFPRIRAQGFLGWQLGPWDAQWTMQYYSKFQVGSRDVREGATAATGFTLTGPNGPYVLHYGSYVYNNVTVGYTIQPINTRVDVGVNNVFDKQPPMLYANNSQNGNTDPNDFDVLGRYYWARLTVSF